jgi:hypothetical protein
MALRNRNPSEPRQSDSPIARVVSKFYGMITGEPATKLPDSVSLLNDNVVDRGDYFNIRGGSKLYTTKKYGISPSMTGSAMFGLGYLLVYIPDCPFSKGDVVYFSGDLHLWNGGVDYGISLDVVEGTAYYLGDNSGGGFYYLHDSEGNVWKDLGKITSSLSSLITYTLPTTFVNYGDINAYCDHIKANKVIFLLGKKVYIADKALTTFTKVFNTYYNDPDGVSTIIPLGDNAILISKTGGMFKIFLDGSFYYMVKINALSPDTLLADIAETVALTFGYLYTYALARISGSGNRDRTSDAVTLQIETAANYDSGSERDYGELYFATAVGDVITESHIVGDNTVIGTAGLLVKGTQSRGMTHMPVYRTKNIGETSGGVSATVDGVGNRRDQLIWNADVPVCKALDVDSQTTAGSLKIVGTGNKFVRGDVGSRIRVVNSAGTSIGSGRITAFVSENEVTVTAYAGETIPVGTTCVACIGGYRVSKASQSGTVVTISAAFTANKFTYDDMGRMLFVSDGTIRNIVSVTYHDPITGIMEAVVKETGDFTNLAVALQADTDSGTAYNRAWNDTIPDKPQADGRVSLQDRIEYGSDIYVPRRFFRPMPDADIAHLDSGFLVTAVRDAGTYYYCQTGDKEYTIGQYKYPEQKRDVSGAIRDIIGYPFKAVVFGKNFTGVLTLNSSQNIGRTEVGENIYVLPELSTVDSERGIIAWKLITYKNANLIFALTNESAFRYFDGSAWSKDDFGFQNGLDAVSKEYLKRIDHSATFGANYNSNGGIKLWMQRYVSGVLTDVCLRFATEAGEGRGWSVISGADWVQPIDELGIFTILDANDIQRVIVVDRNDYRIYEIDTFNRTTQTKKYVLDKESVENTEIAWDKRWREEVAGIDQQHRRIGHEKSYVNILPEFVENRGATGYTATGQRNAQELTLQAYLDGERVTHSADTEDFPENGELVFSGRKVKANTIMMELLGTASEIQVTSLRHEYLAEALAPSRARRLMAEHTLQEELAQDKILHICRTRNKLLNRVTNADLGSATMITGPDGRDYSAHRIAASVTLDNLAVAGVYTIILWSKDANLFTGVAGFTQYSIAVAGWYMYYKQNTGLAASLTLLAGDKADIRIYHKTISADALAKLYDDMINFEGRMTLPGF